MFPYIGGKAHHVKWMDPWFPTDAQQFVEVFGGAGWVSVRSQSITSARNRVYNDFNPLLANVYECFRTQAHQLSLSLASVPVSDLATYKQFQTELFTQLDWATITPGDVDLATKYLYLQTQVFAGTPLSHHNTAYFTDIKSAGKYPSKYDTLRRKLADPRITARLSAITKVESLDCCDLIRKYDSPDTFFYVDPPYYKKEFYYSQDFPREKHAELAQVLTGISGRFALSYYDFPELAEFYPPEQFTWHRQTVYRSAATRSSSDINYSKKSKGTEVLIMNYSGNTK